MIAPINEEPENTPSKPTGGGGALFARADNLRSDARLVARMLSLGVISVEDSERHIRNGFRLADKARKKGDARGWAAVMRVPLECAKLAQNERHKYLDKVIPDQHAHEHSGEIKQEVTVKELIAEPDYVEWLRQRECNSKPSPVCTNGHAGNGKPLDDGPSRNGH